MVDFSCMVQADQVSGDQKTALEGRLASLARELFDDRSNNIAVGWVEIGPGNGFTAGAPSTSSLALAVVPDGTEQATRVKLLEAMCTAWMDVTGCSEQEIVATAAKSSMSE